MYCITPISADTYYVGGSDRRLGLFENAFPIPRGISYNSYLITDEKNVLMDTVDPSVSKLFFENIAHILNGKSLDYVIINHMEPDHAATIGELLLRYPDVTIVCNAKAAGMMKQYFDFDVDSKTQLVKENDTLKTGSHTFTFVMAPMVHWPEAMVTYDVGEKVLYSADAFGTFGALSGNVFADEVNFEADWLDDARRYYTNIVGKYGNQVQTLLKKAATLEISMICPLHGPIWRNDLEWYLDKYDKWSSYTPEENAVLIAYASVYGNTQNAAEILANKLAQNGVRNVAMFDVSVTHPSYILSECFRCSHLVFASTTYNAGIFINMETLMADIKAHNLQNRTVAFIENGTWAATSGKLMAEYFEKAKNITIMENTVSLKSSVKSEQNEQLLSLADKIAADMTKPVVDKIDESGIDNTAMFKLSYGLFVLSANDNGNDNGCIINTVTQITDSPKRISIAVNKANFTHEMIVKTGKFNVSVLSETASFDIIKRFGFQSGKDINKFDGFNGWETSSNGLKFVTDGTNSYISASVVASYDYGTHTVFVADVTAAKTLSDVPSMTYAYYFEHVKPKPKAANTPKKGWVCKICGYVYEGENLPDDFICPLCKHGAEDFEPIK